MNSPTSVRLEDSLGNISVWASLPNLLIFWNDVQPFISGIIAMPPDFRPAARLWLTSSVKFGG